MRVTPGMTADNAVYNLQQSRAAMDKLNEQVASGFQVNKPSDDPLTARQLLDLQHQIAQGDQYSSNISKGSTLLDVASTALSAMSDIMTQIKKIAGDNVSGSSLDPKGVAQSLENLKQQLVDMGNTQSGGQYVFGGFNNNAPPFTSTSTTAADGTVSSTVAFAGTPDELSIQVAQGSKPVPVTAKGGEPLIGTSHDVFAEIDKLKTAITKSPPDTAAISAQFTTMGKAVDQVTASMNTVAMNLVRLNSASTLLSSNRNTLQSVYGNKQNVDYAKAGVELSQQTTAFSAALAATAKISQLSLLDYMT